MLAIETTIMTGIIVPIMRVFVPVFIVGLIALFAVADEAVMKCLK